MRIPKSTRAGPCATLSVSIWLLPGGQELSPQGANPQAAADGATPESAFPVFRPQVTHAVLNPAETTRRGNAIGRVRQPT